MDESRTGSESRNRGGRDRDPGREPRGDGNKYDDPPNSRLFIVCGKNITEDQFKESFGTFGTIEEVWVLKDRTTQEPKGVTYIKFSKTSEAAEAMEEMNGRCIEGSPRPMKVMIAHSRDQGSRRDMNEDERLVRLFIMVPKTSTESDLKSHFSQFGDIDYVSIVKDRGTKESKGFAYVKYHRMSHASKAFEGCDRAFKPVFADPKPTREEYRDMESRGGHGDSSYGHGYGGDRRGGDGHRGSSGRHGHGAPNGPGSTASGSSMSAYDMLSLMDTSTSNPDSCCRLAVSTSGMVNQDQIWKLMDLVPGLDYCEPAGGAGSGGRGKAFFNVIYNNPQSASYAKEKLHGFEYPPGHRIVVKFDVGHDSMRGGPPSMGPPRGGRIGGGPGGSGGPGIQNDLAHLTETIANATALLQAAGYPAGTAGGSTGGSGGQSGGGSAPSGETLPGGETYDPAYCSVKLPPPQPLAAMDSTVSERLFIVCTPVPPQLYAMKDVFGRFGNLIDIYMLNGKTCGYAKYAMKESAERAIEALHGQELCGSRLKVMLADPHEKSKDSSNGDSAMRKRPKISE